MKSNVIFKRENAHNIIVFNSVLWVFSFVILLFLFAGRTSPEKIDIIYTSCFIISLIIPVIINLYVLIPRYLKKEKNKLFILFFLLNLIAFAKLNPLFFELIVNTFFNDYYFISYHNTLEIYFIFFIFFVLTSLSKLAEDWVYLNQVENKLLKNQKQAVEQQLYYLKGQINPHFLFNSLNVLYALAIEEKKEITNAILQLSDILRYVIYDVETDNIPLKKEVNLIENYIAFEKNRQVKNSKIEFNYSLDENKQIYPMLLLPIIENSFKHGVKSGVKNPFVKIKLSEKKENLTFEVSNNFIDNPKLNKNDYKGIGLQNIKENLALIYPEKHQFKTNITNDIFSVMLQINLSE